MSMLVPLRSQPSMSALAEAFPALARPRATRLGTPLDLVHLARQSLGDKGREMELLGHFDHQAGLAGPRLRALAGDDRARAMVKMLGATARTAGAFGVAAACDAYAATLAGGVSEREASRALDILDEEIVIARTAISDLLGR
jgi:hypothetical protein